jgi:hypothetical protein
MHVEAITRCPECTDRLQFSFETGDVAMPSVRGQQDCLRLVSSGYELECRLPTSADLLVSIDRGELFMRCVLQAHSGGQPVCPAQLPEEVLAAVSVAMAQADPMAEVRIALVCPACSHQWSPLFDIVSFLWDEIDEWARRTLREIHTLASAYGWSEHEILGMSARRRRIYLEMVGA